MTAKPVVLFLCTHNAGRSLAAKVLMDHYGHGQVDVRSAGSEPANELNPAVVAVLQERGLDPSTEFPKPLTDGLATAADVVVTMGCGDTCPLYPGKRYLDWELQGGVESPLFEDCDYGRVELVGGFGTGRADVDATLGVVVEQDLGGQAATGVVGAEKEYDRLGGHTTSSAGLVSMATGSRWSLDRSSGVG